MGAAAAAIDASTGGAVGTGAGLGSGEVPTSSRSFCAEAASTAAVESEESSGLATEMLNLHRHSSSSTVSLLICLSAQFMNIRMLVFGVSLRGISVYPPGIRAVAYASVMCCGSFAGVSIHYLKGQRPARVALISHNRAASAVDLKSIYYAACP